MAALDRFKKAQHSAEGFASALNEIRAGAKTGHWIWYVFPQLRGLGTSPMSRTFGIADEAEAAAFLRDPELRSRYATITQAVVEQLRAGTSLESLMGSEIDAMKLVSSLTLFGHVAKALAVEEDSTAFAVVASAADDVLAAAAREGFPPCAATLQRLHAPR